MERGDDLHIEKTTRNSLSLSLSGSRQRASAGCFEAEKVMNMERDAVMRKIKCSSWNENSIMRTLSAPRDETLSLAEF